MPEWDPVTGRLERDLQAGRPVRPLGLSGLLAAGWSAGVGLAAVVAVTLAFWALEPGTGGGPASAVRVAGWFWLLAHHVALSVPGGHVQVMPWGLVALPLALLWRAGIVLGRTTGVSGYREAVFTTGALAVPYALAATVLSALCATRSVQPVPLSAALNAGLVALLAGGAGVWRGSELEGPPARWLRLPAGAWGAWVAGIAGAVVLLGVGATVVAASLAYHAARSAELARAIAPSGPAGVALLVVQLLMVPNAVVWGAALATGPGFALGTGASVSALGSHLGTVPALPLLAALPANGSLPGAARLAFAGPVLAGIAVAAVLSARGREYSWLTSAGWAAAAGGVSGLLMAVAAALAGGAAGPGRLGSVGPSGWRVGLAVAVEVGLVAILAGELVRLWRLRRIAAQGGGISPDPREMNRVGTTT
jgi:hypothetical protein